MATQNNVATLHFGKAFAALSADQQASAVTTMREKLQGVNLDATPAASRRFPVFPR